MNNNNFASNEIIVQGSTASDVFNCLIDTSIWTSYYGNASDIIFYNTEGTILKSDTRFSFISQVFVMVKSGF